MKPAARNLSAVAADFCLSVHESDRCYRFETIESIFIFLTMNLIPDERHAWRLHSINSQWRNHSTHCFIVENNELKQLKVDVFDINPGGHVPDAGAIRSRACGSRGEGTVTVYLAALFGQSEKGNTSLHKSKLWNPWSVHLMTILWQLRVWIGQPISSKKV
ncbi:hypothetical protein [Burkholderia sp. Bp8992]|uniref:hypothetical protein n=1 Tax=Burkholderia sp. Bp8992 TaxID=2184554 RepID=UPI000F564DB4|nr:hypothetical protein [Burkholderia sp. Bp8992]